MARVVVISGAAEHGKTAVANILKDILEADNKKCLIISFANYLKYICKTYYGWDGKKDENGRHILQYVGTDVVRKKNPNFWVKTVIDFIKVFEDDYDYFIIDDCRFKNEVNCFKDNGIQSLSIKVFRNNYKNHLTEEQRMHPSERDMDDYKFDYYIESESGIDNLSVEVRKMYNQYREIYW
jgi:hypothetical protein